MKSIMIYGNLFKTIETLKTHWNSYFLSKQIIASEVVNGLKFVKGLCCFRFTALVFAGLRIPNHQQQLKTFKTIENHLKTV